MPLGYSHIYIINPVNSRTIYIGHGSRVAHNGIALQFSSCIHRKRARFKARGQGAREGPAVPSTEDGPSPGPLRLLAGSWTIDLPRRRVGGEFYRQLYFFSQVGCITTARDWLQLQFSTPEKRKQIIQQKVLLCITSDRDWESHRAVHNWSCVCL